MLKNFVASPKNRTVKLKGGEYVGFARKPLAEKTYFETTLKNGTLKLRAGKTLGKE
jgi:hypothetical protein